MVLALIGNQNCGKTTLFNQLTGSNQHVGNFPGVTVDKKEGLIKRTKDVTVVDLPGIYSLSPYTTEEIVTRDFLIKEKPDGIINILDATNIERNLYLTLQLMELEMPMVIALNMMDEVRSAGGTINIGKLEALLDIPVVPITASKNEGVRELADRMAETVRSGHVHKKMDFCSGDVHMAIHSAAHIIEDKAKAAKIPVFFAASNIISGDKPMEQSLSLDETESDIIMHLAEHMELDMKNDREAALADMRYNYIEKLCRECVIKRGETKEQKRSLKIDSILTHKIFAIPIFIAIMSVIFWLTFTVIGGTLSDLMAMGIDYLTDIISSALIYVGVNDTVYSLIIDGILAGVGSVLSFLPIIITLFFFLSMLEDTGYMARIAFVMDKLLRKIGLSGRSIVPLLIGFGCSVPAVMATRTLPSERDRKMTIMLTPFMSCSAKLPIYAVFTAAFFEKNQAFIMITLYLSGIIIGIIAALLLKGIIFKGKPVPFVMELPAYRIPSVKTTVLHMWEKAKDFFKKAFTVIFLASIIIWFLQSFDYRLTLVENSADSMLAAIGTALSPIFAPLGFGDWRFSTALITGLSAKEAVVSTLSILTGAANNAELMTVLAQLMTPIAAFSFLLFTLLYMPCVATFAAIKREMNSFWKAAGMMAFQTGIAWVIAFLFFSIASLFA